MEAETWRMTGSVRLITMNLGNSDPVGVGYRCLHLIDTYDDILWGEVKAIRCP